MSLTRSTAGSTFHSWAPGTLQDDLAQSVGVPVVAIVPAKDRMVDLVVVAHELIWELTDRLIRSGPGHEPMRHTRREEITLTALYTFDVFSTLDGYASFGPEGDWGGYWGKQGPEFLDRRLALYREPQRLVLGANTIRMFMQSIGPRSGFLRDVDPVNSALRSLPTTVVSTTLEGPLDWPDATLVRGDAVDVVARLKEESDLPLRSHGSLSMNRALMAAGLVDRVQITMFPVVTGRTGTRPVFEGAADFDLELIESRTLDGRIQELTYRPTLHG